MQNIYFDYAATTPVDKAVLRAMMPYFGVKFGNAGSLHSFGQEAITALDHARETVAHSIGAEFREIIFTGSATEANNHALRSVIRGLARPPDGRQGLDADLHGRIQGKLQTNGGQDSFRVSQRKVGVSPRPKVIISAIEHESIFETARDLENEGAEVVIIPVDKRGIIDMKKLHSALDERTVLVSVMYANNEIGVIQQIKEIADIINEFSSTNNESIANLRIRRFGTHPLFVNKPLLHVDAAQAFQFLNCNVDVLGVDLMTLSAHKIYGPKGVGALFVRQQIANRKSQIVFSGRLAISDTRLVPVITGGGQEFGLRSGTENIPLIVGFAKAVELAMARREKERERIGVLMRYYMGGLKKIYPNMQVNGIGLHGNDKALPNIVNVRIPSVRAEEMLMKWDLAGLSASAGSACSARSYEPSRVLQALGYTKKHAQESIRFSFGVPTTKQEVYNAIDIIKMQKLEF